MTSLGKSLWSWSMGRYFGIEVKVHLTFVLMLLLFGAFLGLWYSLLVLCAFFCVLLHEFGHALTARMFGIDTRRILILPIGGLAQLDRMPTRPWAELAIAAAGPMVNLFLAALFAVVFVLAGLELPATPEGVERSAILPLEGSGQENDVREIQEMTGSIFIYYLGMLNFIFFAFNLIPAFPMDGGRILRALLAFALDYVRATRVAARTGQFFAIVFILYSILSTNVSPVLALIGVFVFVSAGAEATLVRLRFLLKGHTVSEAMLRSFETAAADEPLWKITEKLRGGLQTEFPVVGHGEEIGMLTRETLVRELRRRGPGATLENCEVETVDPLDPDDPLPKALETLNSLSVSALPVVRDGELVGLLTRGSLDQFTALAETTVSSQPQLPEQS